MGAGGSPGLTPGEVLELYVGAFVDELARCGLRHVCVCPGSRSTPLAVLFRRDARIRVWTHLDERSAAFFALGIAKASREPAAVLCSSGTAAVNFAPAVFEAHHAQVPLLVLTADRPPELRDTGALQTIDQVGLYGSSVRWAVDMLLPEAGGEALRYVRSVAARAWARARRPRAGPVHLNFPFREPLIPAGARVNQPAYENQPHVSVHTGPRRLEPAAAERLALDLASVERGVIVCGPQDDPDFPAAVAGLGAALRFPVLADPLSQVRSGPHHSDLVIDSYDAFLRQEDVAAALEPDVVLRFGALPVSKALQSFLQRHEDRRQVLFLPGGDWNDPALVAGEALDVDATNACQDLLAALRQAQGVALRQAQGAAQTARGGTRRSAASGWADRWRTMDETTRAALSGGLEREERLSEPGVFAALAGLLPPGATVFVGNSMPVRDLDSFFPGGRKPIRFLTNRGVSGIDGVVSSALGAGAVSDGPFVLVIGDVSFYHDMNGLLAARRHGLRGTIILLNNDGGGIFSFLPQAEETEHFEELFGTPHGLDFHSAAELYGLGYSLAGTRGELSAELARSFNAPGVSVIEVCTDRRENLDLHRRLWAVAAAAALRSTEGRPAS